MRSVRTLAAVMLVMTLAACGGGGGSAGTTVSGTSTTPTTSTSTQTASLAITVLSGAGVATTAISAAEIARVSVEVKNAAGARVPGVVVTFGESGASLLAFAPVSKTALTDDAGVATVEVRAASATGVGATTITAAASVGGAALSSQRAIAITQAPTGGGAVNPQTLANAVNFLNVNPSDKSIVLAGSGGNGRSESATLRFRVVDTNNSPVKDAQITFSVVPAADVTLNIPTASSDAEGVVVTTVSSKNVATAVVVTATVNGRPISSQSDQLLVTTGVATAGGFDLSASKFNLNSELTGDSSGITVRIVDANGNPVADGVPVVFTANYGRVGTSAQGGCTTSNGQCSVDFMVQDPRPTDGTLAQVTASTRIGNGTTISDVISFALASPSLMNLYNTATGGTAVTEFNLGTSCQKQTFRGYIGTPAALAPPAGTALFVTSETSNLNASLTPSSSPILDQRPLRVRPLISIEVDPTAAALGCVEGGTPAPDGLGLIRLRATSAPNSKDILIEVRYPK